MSRVARLKMASIPATRRIEAAAATGSMRAERPGL